MGRKWITRHIDLISKLQIVPQNLRTSAFSFKRTPQQEDCGCIWKWTEVHCGYGTLHFFEIKTTEFKARLINAMKGYLL